MEDSMELILTVGIGSFAIGALFGMLLLCVVQSGRKGE